MIWKDSRPPFARFVGWLGLLWFLAGCQPMLTAAPLPTLTSVRVQFTPALQKETVNLQACSQKEDALGLLVEKVPAQAMDPKKADLSLRIGLPAGSQDFTADLGKIEIAVIVHPKLDQSRIALAELASVYSGKTHDFQAWTYLNSDDLREAFDGMVLGNQAGAKDLHETPNPQAMVAVIAQTPGAIGYIPKEWLDPSVKALQLDEPLSAPVVGLAASEPKGAARRLLACLQQ